MSTLKTAALPQPLSPDEAKAVDIAVEHGFTLPDAIAFVKKHGTQAVLIAQATHDDVVSAAPTPAAPAESPAPSAQPTKKPRLKWKAACGAMGNTGEHGNIGANGEPDDADETKEAQS